MFSESSDRTKQNLELNKDQGETETNEFIPAIGDSIHKFQIEPKYSTTDSTVVVTEGLNERETVNIKFALDEKGIPIISSRHVAPENKLISELMPHVLDSQASSAIKGQAKKYIGLIREKTRSLRSELKLPPLAVSFPSENELLITWDIPHIRIGISLEDNEDQSSWYAVTDGAIQATNAWGYFKDLDNESLIDFLVSYLVKAYGRSGA